ncbi:hypothetical protein G9A89_004646 [Geosiphon pyriformis]|nr:hypothetical protein G9A89_004646 [Geosiphon pyriformis]
MDIFGSDEFSVVKDGLHNIWSGFFEVFTNRSLKYTGSAGITSKVAAYFLVLDLCVGVLVHGLVFSIMAKLQAVVLFLECILFSSIVFVYLNSQTIINACIAELFSAVPDFCNLCWIERCYIFNLIRKKDLNVAWIKIKRHSEVSSNVTADLITGVIAYSSFLLLTGMHEHFLVANNISVSDNACHFVRDIF